MASEHNEPQHGSMPRWAGRVPQQKIKQLYETDAKGIYDEELIDDVGWGLYARCQSLLEAEAARGGRAKCHQCGGLIQHSGQRDELLGCPECGWQITWGAYFRSIQHRQLSGPDLVSLLTDYVARFPRATAPREKMLLIDRLVHGFHWSVKTGPRRPAAVNLIGGRLSEVIQFLDSLTYDDRSTPGTKERHVAWRKDMSDALESWGAPRLNDGAE